MPQNQNDLLMQLLLGGNQPDPTAQFIAQSFLKGQVPGDQGAAYQNVLTNLAPSVIAERRRLGPQPGEGLGVSGEDTSQAIKQMLGLIMSPQQMQSQKMDALELMQDFFTEQQKIGQAQTGIETEQGKLAVAERNAASLEEMRKANEELAKSRKRDLDDIIEIRKMVSEGKDLDGTPLTERQRRFLSSVAGAREDPRATNMLRLAGDFLYSGMPGEREVGIGLIAKAMPEFDFSEMADPAPWFIRMLKRVEKWLPGRSGGQEGSAPIEPGVTGEPSGPEGGGPQGVSGLTQEQLDEFTRMMQQEVLGLREDVLREEW